MKGIKGNNMVLVCVDFSGKSDAEKPDFYILNEEDWNKFVEAKYFKELILADDEKRKLVIDENNVPCWINQKSGSSCFKGIDFKPMEILEHKDTWEKINKLFNL